jgi:hypothetical protein
MTNWNQNTLFNEIIALSVDRLRTLNYFCMYHLHLFLATISSNQKFSKAIPQFITRTIEFAN